MIQQTSNRFAKFTGEELKIITQHHTYRVK